MTAEALHLDMYFAALAPQLIVEFVPKSDSQVRRLLASREDIFPEYTPAGFERAFGQTYEILQQEAIPDSERVLYFPSARSKTFAFRRIALARRCGKMGEKEVKCQSTERDHIACMISNTILCG